MVTFLSTDDQLAARIVTFQANQLGLNDVHYKVGPIVNTPSIEGVLQAMDIALSALYIPAMSNNASYVGIGLRRIVFGATVEFTTRASFGPGTGGAGSVPLAVTGIITKYAAGPGKANRGRIYVPFPSVQLSTVAGEPLAGYITLLNAIRNQLFTTQTYTTGLNSADLIPQIFHKGSPLRQVAAVNAIPGHTYKITFPGTTDFTAMGSPDSVIGTIFLATKKGLGNGLMQEAIVFPSMSTVIRSTTQPRFATQHRRGDYGKLNVVPF